jgi:hypothetical protein
MNVNEDDVGWGMVRLDEDGIRRLMGRDGDWGMSR